MTTCPRPRTWPTLDYGAPTPRAALPIDHATRRRAIRVWLLMATIVVLSLADLYMTLTYLRTVGMGEANPLARYVISYNSPWLLGLWKCASVALACLIFHIARHRRSGEAACWACLGVLAALTLHWMDYSAQAAAMTPQLHIAQQGDAGINWMTITD